MTNLSMPTNYPISTTKNYSNKATQLQSNNQYISRELHKSDPQKAALHKAASEFEAIFIKQMLNAMKKTTLKSSLTGISSAQNIFEDLLYDEYSKTMASTGNFGIAKSLYNQLSGRM